LQKTEKGKATDNEDTKKLGEGKRRNVVGVFGKGRKTYAVVKKEV